MNREHATVIAESIASSTAGRVLLKEWALRLLGWPTKPEKDVVGEFGRLVDSQVASSKEPGTRQFYFSEIMLLRKGWLVASGRTDVSEWLDQKFGHHDLRQCTLEELSFIVDTMRRETLATRSAS